MCQRDINVISLRGLAEEAEQIFDDGREEGVDAEEEEGSEQERHDHHHDAGGDGFLAGRPVDLAGLDTDLTDEFAGGDFRHFCSAHLRIEKRPADLSGRRGCGSLSGAGLSLQGMAGVEGLEPPALGFGVLWQSLKSKGNWSNSCRIALKSFNRIAYFAQLDPTHWIPS